MPRRKGAGAAGSDLTAYVGRRIGLSSFLQDLYLDFPTRRANKDQLLWPHSRLRDCVDVHHCIAAGQANEVGPALLI
jgi:hypothetical protein